MARRKLDTGRIHPRQVERFTATQLREGLRYDQAGEQRLRLRGVGRVRKGVKGNSEFVINDLDDALVTRVAQIKRILTP